VRNKERGACKVVKGEVSAAVLHVEKGKKAAPGGEMAASSCYFVVAWK
jgi:hypothetical protein